MINWLRATTGFLLSFVFLLIFIYMISGAQWLLSNAIPGEASISGAVQNVDAANQQVATPSMQQPLPVAPPTIDAEAAIATESNLSGQNNILFEQDGNNRLSIASLTKLMTAIIALDNYNLATSTSVDSVGYSQDTIENDVALGQTLPLESFFDIMLIESSNKSAYTLSEVMGEPKFVAMMNEKAKEIGLQNTVFADPTGLSDQDVSTASDLAKLAEYILKNYPKIADVSRMETAEVPDFGVIKNTDELLGQVPGVVFSKTGFTNEANGCLLLVVNNAAHNDYIINVVLGADDRFAEMTTLLDWENNTTTTHP